MASSDTHEEDPALLMSDMWIVYRLVLLIADYGIQSILVCCAF